MHSLPILLRLTGRPVILLGGGEAADAKRRLLERAGALVVGEDGDARLAIVAVDEDAAAQAAVARLKARGILVNAVDRPALCDFTLPAVVERGPVLVAVGTGGASAGLAKALRQRLEAWLPAGLGALAEALQGARAGLRARFPDPADRRRAIDAALDPGGALDPWTGGGDVAAWLAAAEPVRPPRLVRIMLRSPDPDDLTLGEARMLGAADRVYHPAHVPAAILDRARADAARIRGAAPRVPPPGLSIELGTA